MVLWVATLATLLGISQSATQTLQAKNSKPQVTTARESETTQSQARVAWNVVLCFSYRTSMSFCSPLISRIHVCEPSRPHQNFLNSLRKVATGCYCGSDGYHHAVRSGWFRLSPADVVFRSAPVFRRDVQHADIPVLFSTIFNPKC